MVIWGTTKKVIKKGKINNVACPACDEQTTLHYAIEMKYFHLYWIPFFPLKKITVAYCSQCQTDIEEKYFTTTIKSKLVRENEISPARYPVWSFAIILILALLIPLAFLQSNNADTIKNSYVNHPQVGDLYYLSNDDATYTTMKVMAVEKDTVHFLMNDTVVTKFTKVFGITDESYYSNKLKSLSKKEIVTLYKNDNIYSIDRKK